MPLSSSAGILSSDPLEGFDWMTETAEWFLLFRRVPVLKVYNYVWGLREFTVIGVYITVHLTYLTWQSIWHYLTVHLTLLDSPFDITWQFIWHYLTVHLTLSDSPFDITSQSIWHYLTVYLTLPDSSLGITWQSMWDKAVAGTKQFLLLYLKKKKKSKCVNHKL